MNEYLIFAEKKPEPKKTIEYIDIYGLHGYAYLCARCLNCWREPITGSGLMIDVVKWRYAKDYKINVDKKI